MASKIKVDQIEGSTGSSITIPSGQTLTVTDGLSASVIGSGTLADARIPDLNASKITAGTISDARLPSTALNSNVDLTNLSATNLTSGTIADARLPATALNSNVDLTNLSASNLTSGTVPTARLGSGTANSSTFLRGDGTFAEAGGGGDFVKLATTTVSSAVSSITFDGLFSSTYKKYKLIATGLVQAANNSYCYMRIRQSNNDVTASSYMYIYQMKRVIHTNSETYTALQGNNSISYIPLTDTHSSNSSFSTNFDVDIYDPQNSLYKVISFDSSSWYNHDGSTANYYFKSHDGHGTYRGNTTAWSGVTIYPSSGNFSSGSLSLYGLTL